MKKVAIGCGVVALVLVVALGIGGYLVARSARSYIESYAELAQVAELNQRVENRASFQPPADQRLTASQLDRYVSVQRAMLEQLGNRVRELEGKYSQLSEDLRAQGRDANVRELLSAWRDVISLVVSAKESQVNALNAAGFSLAEYHWVRQQVLLTLGVGYWGLNLEAIADDPASLLEALDASPDTLDADALQHNRELLSRYEDTYEEWLPLSFFGL